MIYVKLRIINLPATVTNKRSHVAKRLADDLIIRYERGEISRLEFVSEVSYRWRKEWHVRNIPSKMRGCEAAQKMKWSRALTCSRVAGIFFFKRCCKLNISLLYWILLLHPINKIKCKQVFSFHCTYSHYARYKKLLQCRAVVTLCEDFLLRTAAGPSSWRKY